MLEYRVARECFFCRRPFHVDREGQHIPQWNLDRCNPCYEKYRFGGIVTRFHPELLLHFQRKGIEPSFNPSGFVDWPRY